MKENDGKGIRRRRRKICIHVCAGISCGLLLLRVICIVFVANSNSAGQDATTEGKVAGGKTEKPNTNRNKKVLKGNNSLQQRGALSQSNANKQTVIISRKKNTGEFLSKKENYNGRNNKSDNADVETRILNGELHLINLHIPSGALRAEEDGTSPTYKGVRGLFCPLDWSLQKKDPASVPMFKHLVSQSPSCERDTHSIYSFSNIVQKARTQDKITKQSQTSMKKNVIISMDTAGFIFHESRCGSTLVSNILAAVSPEEHRVYSESTPIINAIMACHNRQDSKDDHQDAGQCNDIAAAELLKDVVYMMGRTNDLNEKRQYFKMQSIAIEKINVLTLAFPNTPWIFLYRDPIQVMMSYFKNGDKSNSLCLRGYHNRERLSSSTVTKSNGMSKEEFCAATLASFCEGAIRHHEMTGTGRFINYNSLKDVLIGTILSEDFGIIVGKKELERIEQVSSIYSKKRSHRGDGVVEWVEDSTEKESSATSEVRIACDKILMSSYTKLQHLAL